MNSRILLISVVLISYSCQEQKTTSCKDYELAYISKASGNFDIYLNDLKGNEKQLTFNPSWDWNPMWNEASSSLFTYAYVNDTFRIQHFDLEGKAIPFDTELTEYNLSPDGTMLVFQERVDDFSKLVLTDLDGKNPQDITPADAYHGRAKWSPNSLQLTYISDRDGNNEIYLYDLTNKSTQRLTSNATNEKYMAWGPEGKRLAFTTQYYEEGQPDRNDVFTLKLSSGDIQQITDNPYDDAEISWYPHPDRIAFHSKRDSADHIYTMRIDGTDVQQISSQPFYHGEPVWVAVTSTCE